MSDTKKGQNQLNIELPEEVAEGTYSNLAIISHSNSEFVVDFIRLVPNVPKAKVKSRIILTPQHAKRLLRALADNVKKFEAQHGIIDEPEQPPFPPMSLPVRWPPSSCVPTTPIPMSRTVFLRSCHCRFILPPTTMILWCRL